MSKDATNTEYSATNWPANNSALTQTFTASGGAGNPTILRVVSAGSGSPEIAHLYVEAAPANSPVPFVAECPTVVIGFRDYPVL